MRLSRSLRALGAVLLIASALALVADAQPASALTKKRITIDGAHKVFDGDYPPIPASFEESTTAVTPTPTGCGNPDGTPDSENPPPFGAMCDTIPLRINPPTDIGPADDYVVTIVVSWDDNAGEPVGAGGTVADLDLHFFDNGQIAKRADPEDTSTTEITSSAGATIPESIKICCPDLIDYNIVVVNAGAGPNTGYHVHVEMKILKAEKIFELLAESPTATTRPDDPGTLPEDLSNVPLPVGIDDLASVPGLDTDFGDLASAPLEKALEGLPSGTETVGISKPSPVSGMTVALWLALMPALGIASAAVFAWRRRNAVSSLI
jgi:hypothetical protein